MWHKWEIVLCCCVTFYYEIIVYSHAVVRNSTKRSLIPPIQFPSVVASYLTTDQYHNQEIDIGEIHWFDSDFTSFPSSGVTGINSSTPHCICLLVFLKATYELLKYILIFFWAHRYHVFIWKALGCDQNVQKSEYWHMILLTVYGHSIWLPLLHLTLFSKN